MDIEENAPSADADFEIFHEIGRRRYRNILHSGHMSRIKAIGQVNGVVVCILMIADLTQYLLSSHETIAHDSSRPLFLVLPAAVLGAILIIGGIVGVFWATIATARDNYRSVGFGPQTIAYTTVIFITTTWLLIELIVYYLTTVFYS